MWLLRRGLQKNGFCKGMGMIRKLVLLALVLAIAVPVAGCGRKGALDAPEGTEYPREYPSR